MSSPIVDKAEVSIDFPDKFYHGSFGRGSSFEVKADREGIHLHLDRTSGEKRHVGLHVHYYLLADLLEASAEAVAGVQHLDAVHRDRLKAAARRWLELP